MKAMALRPADRYRLGPRPGRGGRALAGRRAGAGPARAGLGAGAAVDATAADGRGRDRRGPDRGHRRAHRRPRRPDPSQRRRSGRPTSTWRWPTRTPATPTATSGSPTSGSGPASTWRSRPSRRFTAGSARTCCSRRSSSTACGPGCSTARPTSISGWRTCSRAQADRHSRAALGQAYHDIGELTAKIGSQTEALAALQRGLELRLALAAEPGADAAVQPGRGREPDRRRRPAGGDRRSHRGAGLLRAGPRPARTSARSKPDEPSYRAAVAKCLHGIARVQYHTRPRRGGARLARAGAGHLPGPGRRPPRRHRSSRATSRRATTTSAPSTGPAAASTEALASYRTGPGHPPEADRGRPHRHPVPERPGPELHRHRLHAARDRAHPPRHSRRSSRRGRSSRSSPTPTPRSLSSRATWRRATRASARSRIRPAIRPRRWRRSSGRGRSCRSWSTPTRRHALFQTRLAMNHSYVGQARQRARTARRGGRRVPPGRRHHGAALRPPARAATTSTTWRASGRCSRASRPSRAPD